MLPESIPIDAMSLFLSFLFPILAFEQKSIHDHSIKQLIANNLRLRS